MGPYGEPLRSERVPFHFKPVRNIPQHAPLKMFKIHTAAKTGSRVRTQGNRGFGA